MKGNAATKQAPPASGRRVASSVLAPGVSVSTVRLTFVPPGEPEELYQTAVFGGPMGGECRQYRTRVAAWKGHWSLVQAVCGVLAGALAEDCSS